MGEGHSHKEAPSHWDLFRVWGDEWGHGGRGPPLGITLRKGWKAQPQIGNRWGHRARPKTPDPQGWVERREKEGRPHPGSQSRPALLPGADLKTPGLRKGTRRPHRSWELGRRSGRGRDPDRDPRTTAGAGSSIYSYPWLKCLMFHH